MKRNIIEEIGSASRDEEDNDQKSAIKKNPNLVKSLNNLDLFDTTANVDNVLPEPIKTVGENTKNSETMEKHDYMVKPACEPKDKDVGKTALHFDQANQPAIENKPSSKSELPASSVVDKKSSLSSLCDLKPPSNSIQFQRTWKQLECSPEHLYAYMKVVLC